jgi:flagellar hook-associated protein 3 FlgL
VLRGLRGNLEVLRRAQEEVVTGRRVLRVSDEPTDAAWIMKLGSQIRANETYQRTVTNVETRLSTEEAVLETVDGLLTRAKELAPWASGSDDPTMRATVREELLSIRSQIISLGNTELLGEYIFAGGATDTSPFLQDGTYVGDSTPRLAEIESGVLLETNHTGDQFLTDAIAALDELAGALDGSLPVSVAEIVESFDQAQEEVRLAEAQNSARSAQLADAETRLTRAAAELTDREEDLREVDPTEAVLRLTAAQTALERAYAIVGQVLSANIVDYLA